MKPKKQKKTLLRIVAIVLGILVFFALPFLAGWCRLERLALPAGAEAVAEARVRIDKKKPIHIGDPVRYSVVVQARSSGEIGRPTLPKAQAEGAAFEIKPLRASGRQLIWGGIRQQFDYELRFFDVGQITLDRASVGYRNKSRAARTLTTNTVAVTVQSLLPKDAQAEPELKDVKPPVELPVNYAAIVAGLIALAGLIYAAVWLWRRRRGSRKQIGAGGSQTMVEEPAHVIAFRALAALRDSACWVEADTAVFFVRLSDCIRTYVQNRFGIKAPESTTEELLPLVSAHPEVEDAARPLLAGLADLWDQVKFGRHMPPREMITDAWQKAYRLVELTQREFQAPAGESAPGTSHREVAS